MNRCITANDDDAAAAAAAVAYDQIRFPQPFFFFSLKMWFRANVSFVLIWQIA
jgi:hypothetical protein